MEWSICYLLVAPVERLSHRFVRQHQTRLDDGGRTEFEALTPLR
jgi:hypothetical protein